ncbi:MAG: hypothetical protein V4713_05970 [Pseudomonadota bacterium]
MGTCILQGGDRFAHGGGFEQQLAVEPFIKLGMHLIPVRSCVQERGIADDAVKNACRILNILAHLLQRLLVFPAPELRLGLLQQLVRDRFVVIPQRPFAVFPVQKVQVPEGSAFKKIPLNPVGQQVIAFGARKLIE